MDKLAVALLLFLCVGQANAQQDAATDQTEIDKIRTESGVDPTRVASRFAYSIIVLDPRGAAVELRNRVKYTLGVNRWSFAIREELISEYSGDPGTGFDTGPSDVTLSVLNAFYTDPMNAFAVSVEASFPTGSSSVTSNCFTVTPQVVYSRTISTEWVFAVQPQYTFDVYKDSVYPDVNVLTVRSFIANFNPSGLFFVFEPRPIYDFEAEQFDLIVSPIAGTSLGGGFTLSLLFEFPMRNEMYDTRGVWTQMGLSKTF